MSESATPYVDLTTPEAVEELMSPEGGAGVIDFWAPWCGPCRTMAPHFEAVAGDYRDAEVTFYKINTEAAPALGRAFNVRSIPTLMFVLDGVIVDVVVGVLDRGRLAKKVDWLLSKARGEGLLSRLFGKSRKGT